MAVPLLPLQQHCSRFPTWSLGVVACQHAWPEALGRAWQILLAWLAVATGHWHGVLRCIR